MGRCFCEKLRSIYSMISNLKFLKIVLFILGVLGLCCCSWAFLSLRRAGAPLAVCGVRASHCGGFLCSMGSRARRLQQLQHVGSIVVAHGFSCCKACGVLPDQGSNLCFWHWQADSLPLSHPGSPYDFKS